MAGRDELMALLSRAFREHFPDDAEARLREIERATPTASDVAAAPGARADDIALAMNRIERETQGGARCGWAVSARPRVDVGGDSFVVTVRAEPSAESLSRDIDQMLAPLVKQGLPAEAALALPVLQPLITLLRAAVPGQSPLELMSTVIARLQSPPRMPALADAETALRAAFPDRAAELVTALQRLMPQFAPPIARGDLRDDESRPVDGLALAEIATSLATRLEDRQPGGARYRWTARQRGATLEILREPIG